MIEKNKNLEEKLKEIEDKKNKLETMDLTEEEFEIKKSQLKKQKILIENKIKNKDRKQRTRQLIQLGALTEKIFKLDHTEDMKILEEKLIDYANKLNIK